ncbi:CCA tRNA nucleotidyltransferase, partial [Mycobacteroides abscessus subsp. abscessus]
RKRMRALKYSKQMVEDVSQLVYLHLRFHGYGDGKWTDSAVRRYVTDAGPLLSRLHKLVRADCTTRNKRRAARLRANYDDLEARIAELAAKEDLQR